MPLTCLVNAWIIPIKDKKGTSIVNTFQKIISEKKNPNKIWVDQDSEFYNHSFKDFLKISNIEMYSTYNEGKMMLQIILLLNTMKILIEKVLNLKLITM